MNDFIKLHDLKTRGCQSVISLGTFNGQLAIRKKIGYGVDHLLLRTWIDKFNIYRRNVENVGSLVPKNFYIKLVCSYDCSYIEVVDEYLGIDTIDSLIDNSLLDAWHSLIGHLVNNFNPAVHLYQTKVMLDVKPENFVFTNNSLYYIDFFPPILSDSEGNISPFDKSIFKRNCQLLLKFKFGDIRGQVTRLLFLMKGMCSGYMYVQLIECVLKLIRDKLSLSAEKYIRSQIDNDFVHMRLFCSEDKEHTHTVLKSLMTY